MYPQVPILRLATAFIISISLKQHSTLASPLLQDLSITSSPLNTTTPPHQPLNASSASSSSGSTDTHYLPPPHADIDCVESHPLSKHPYQVRQFCLQSLHTFLFTLPSPPTTPLHWSTDPFFASPLLGILPFSRDFSDDGYEGGRGLHCHITFTTGDDEYGEPMAVDEWMTPEFVYQVGAVAVRTCFEEEKEGIAFFGRGEEMMLVVSGSVGLGGFGGEGERRNGTVGVVAATS